MPEVIYAVDQSKSFFAQDVPGHNRWHPDIPPVATVRPGSEFRLECREWFDGTIHHDDSADDVRNADLSIVHALSGPVAVEGATPGDLLVIDILDMGPVPQQRGPEGQQHYLDSQLAYRQACLNAITYLTRFGYSREQAYLILGAAPIEGRFSGVVDVPNSCATVYVPTAIFNFDIRPHATGPQPADRGHCAA